MLRATARAEGELEGLWRIEIRCRRGEAIGAQLPLSERADHAQSIATARAALGDAAFEAAWAKKGEAWSLERAIAEAQDDGMEG